MLWHGYSSPCFRKSVIFPIAKNKQKAACDSYHYQGISITNVNFVVLIVAAEWRQRKRKL